MVIKRWRNTSIIALAIFIPRQVLPPIPKAKNLYGFDSSCWMAKGKKKHFIKLCLLYNIAFWKILNPLFTLMEKIEKKIDFATQKLTSNLCGLNLLGSLYTIGSRCIDLASMFMFHPLLILNPTMINTLHEIKSCRVYCTNLY